MPLKQPRPRETLPAILALATLVVSSHVHGKGRHTNINLVAVRTPSGFLIRGAAMGLTVSGEIAGGAVSLAAFSAFVFVALGS